MSEHDPAHADPGEDDYDVDNCDLDDCPDCGGAGGYAMCMEDWCPIIGGEDCCDDPACWRSCMTCGGRG